MTEQSDDREIVDTAFAIGGLVGHNYHGLGVLQAALDMNVSPQLISCGSAQIYWEWNYVLARRNQLQNEQGVKDIEELALKSLEAAKKHGPAYIELIQHIPVIISNTIRKLVDFTTAEADPLARLIPLAPVLPTCGSSDPFSGRRLQNADQTGSNGISLPLAYFLNIALNNIPEHVLVPALSEHDCEKISRRFEDERDIGIVFNS